MLHPIAFVTQPGRFAAPLLMAGASLLFATMGVAVKLASAHYAAGEIVFYRGLVGVALIAAWVRWRGGTLRTPVPAMHLQRSLAGVGALLLWFFAIGGLPLATAMTLNYMSSVWMAVFLVAGAWLFGTSRIDGRLVAAVLAGFAGVALVLRPTIDERQLVYGLAGLASGVLAAIAYLQVGALGRAGEPEPRTVFYFSLGGVAGGAATMAVGGASAHSLRGVLLLLAVGLLATLAQAMMTRAYAIGRTLGNAALQYLGIVFATAYGLWLFDEAVTASAALGIALIVAAGLAATLLRTRAGGRADAADA
ncbi:MAG: DMT family transporter [Rubrivivax sp.]|jgi:S-adenosylmethionine uptake transporter|nr:DMT family transporter [Rubrivivax sp.]